jgi:hypothetical protein
MECVDAALRHILLSMARHSVGEASLEGDQVPAASARYAPL